MWTMWLKYKTRIRCRNYVWRISFEEGETSGFLQGDHCPLLWAWVKQTKALIISCNWSINILGSKLWVPCFLIFGLLRCKTPANYVKQLMSSNNIFSRKQSCKYQIYLPKNCHRNVTPLLTAAMQIKIQIPYRISILQLCSLSSEKNKQPIDESLTDLAIT